MNTPVFVAVCLQSGRMLVSLWWNCLEHRRDSACFCPGCLLDLTILKDVCQQCRLGLVWVTNVCPCCGWTSVRVSLCWVLDLACSHPYCEQSSVCVFSCDELGWTCIHRCYELSWACVCLSCEPDWTCIPPCCLQGLGVVRRICQCSGRCWGRSLAWSCVLIPVKHGWWLVELPEPAAGSHLHWSPEMTLSLPKTMLVLHIWISWRKDTFKVLDDFIQNNQKEKFSCDTVFISLFWPFSKTVSFVLLLDIFTFLFLIWIRYMDLTFAPPLCSFWVINIQINSLLQLSLRCLQLASTSCIYIILQTQVWIFVIL